MRIRTLRAAALAVIAASAISCNQTDSPTTPILFVGPADLVATDLRVGTGAAIAAGQTATVHYGLWLYNPSGVDSKGALIEDSRLTSAVNTGVTIRIQTGSVIAGWVQGVPGMRVGGARRLIIPPSLAYGSTGSGPIPANAWIVFDIDLLSIAN
jgi:FKBP-type peptidyl-prolyl cis-trans isomerase